MVSSMDFILCCWDGSLIPLTFSWKVTGIDVSKMVSLVLVELDTDAGSCQVDEHLLGCNLSVELLGHLLCRLSSFVWELIEFATVG